MGKNLTIMDFITKANSMHNNKYDYSSVNYVNTTMLVNIICPIHGLFTQKPKYHLLGKGCSVCCGKNKTTNQ